MRCNVGVNPKYLTDQHLIAEYRELPMLIGSLKHWNWTIKSDVPVFFHLGTGHINFLKNKLKYIQRRHEEVVRECHRRYFHCDSLRIDLNGIPQQFCNDWSPTLLDSRKIRDRINTKLLNKTENFWRYEGVKINVQGLYDVIRDIRDGELYYV